MKTNELLEKKLKKYSVKQLFEKLEKNKATEEEIPVIVSILKLRGQDVSNWVKEIVSQHVQDSIDTESWSNCGSDSEIKLSEREQLAQEVDEFVDILIASHREGVYTEVMKALGGHYESDLDELLDITTVEQMQNALSFKNPKSNKLEVIGVIQKDRINNQKAQEKFEKDVKIERIEKNNKYFKESKEILGLKSDVVVCFDDKKGTQLRAKIVKFFLSHKNNSEICELIFDDKKIVHKRTNKLKRINE